MRPLLGTWTETAPSPWMDVVNAFSELTDADKAVCFGVTYTQLGHRLAFAHDVGFPVPFRSTFHRMVGAENDVSLLDPSPREGNLPMAMPSLRELLQRGRSATHLSPFGTGQRAAILRLVELKLDHFKQLGISDDAQLRVLLCDGTHALGWFGSLRRAPFGSRERAILRALVPALQHRLLLERDLERAHLDRVTLTATLESIPSPSFILTASGTVAHCNAAARALLDRQGTALLTQLHEAVHRGTRDTHFRVTPVRAVGHPAQYLLVARPASDPAGRLGLAETRWRLTPGQRVVLEQLVHGRSNRAIASILGLSSRTVEAHVAAIIDKAAAESRVDLVAQFWSRL